MPSDNGDIEGGAQEKTEKIKRLDVPKERQQTLIIGLSVMIIVKYPI